MNERIRELVEQAIVDVDVVYEDNPLNEELAKMYIPDCFAEKFAESIVRECCDVLQTETIRHDGYGYNQGFLHKKIKDHFGVES